MGVGIEFGHVFEQAIRPREKNVLETAETINRMFRSCVEFPVNENKFHASGFDKLDGSISM